MEWNSGGRTRDRIKLEVRHGRNKNLNRWMAVVAQPTSARRLTVPSVAADVLVVRFIEREFMLRRYAHSKRADVCKGTSRVYRVVRNPRVRHSQSITIGSAALPPCCCCCCHAGVPICGSGS